MPLPRPRPAAGLLAPVALGLLLVGPAGCGPRAAATKPDDGPAAVENPWPKVVAVLRKETDAAAARRALAQLGSDLAEATAAEQPAGLTPDAEKALTALVPLTPADLNEVRSPVYSPLDAPYLADCFYLRDAARSLESAAASPARQADAAFAWVCRQVELRAWVQVVGDRLAQQPPVPPGFVLRRGSGSGLERAFAFLAVLQQFGLDGCLIGPPEAADRPSFYRPDGTPADQPSPGPFWAVAARVGPDLLLFDPWRGVPVAGPGGRGTATLAQVVADPSLLKPVLGEKADVAGAAKAAVPFVAAPLSALAPRNRLLEESLRDETPVRLTLDPTAVKARFAAEARQDVRFWNPPADRYTYTRGLGAFLPADEGGNDTSPAGKQLYGEYRRSQIPPSVFAFPGGLTSAEAQRQLLVQFVGRYLAALVESPSPRERIQRGQFFEATPDLVKKRQQFLDAKQRSTQQSADAGIGRWVEAANAAYGRLARARLDKNADAEREAEQVIAEFWRANASGTLALVDVVVSEPGAAEATYLLALCKHEQAERAQNRLDAARGTAAAAAGRAREAADRGRDQAADKARDAWADARDWWGRYDPYAASQNAAFPGRADHARRLAARAAELAGR